MSLDITKLSAAKLTALVAARAHTRTLVIDQCIASGMGAMRGDEIRTLAKSSSLLSKVRLARVWVATIDACNEAWAEEDARRRYSGTLKPIKRNP